MVMQLDTRPATRKLGTPYSDLYVIHSGMFGRMSEQMHTGITDLLCRTCGMLFGVATSDDPGNHFIRGAVSLEPIYTERGATFFAAAEKPPRGQRGTMADERLTLRLACFISGGVSRGVTIVQLDMLPISVKCRHCGCINEVIAN